MLIACGGRLEITRDLQARRSVHQQACSICLQVGAGSQRVIECEDPTRAECNPAKTIDVFQRHAVIGGELYGTREGLQQGIGPHVPAVGTADDIAITYE